MLGVQVGIEFFVSKTERHLSDMRNIVKFVMLIYLGDRKGGFDGQFKKERVSAVHAKSLDNCKEINHNFNRKYVGYYEHPRS